MALQGQGTVAEVAEALQPFIGQWQTNPRLGISGNHGNHGSQSDLWIDFFDAMDSQLL